MVRETPRRRVSGTWLTVALSSVWLLAAAAQAAPDAASKEAEIDSFLNDLQRTTQTTPTPPARATPAPATKPSVPAPATESATAAAASVAQASGYPTQTLDEQSPFRTLLLMFGGILICATATVGLTLAVFALRKDQRKKRRARQRRFIPYPPRNETPVTHS